MNKIDPQSIGIVTSTLYPKWYPGEMKGPPILDKVRGDLALQMLYETVRRGYQVLDIDSENTAKKFKEKLSELKIPWMQANEETMSGQRRFGFSEISKKEGVKVIYYTEPEKVSVITDCVNDPTLLILLDGADIVIPKREEKLFQATYPQHQVFYEKRSNEFLNTMLRRHGLLLPEVPDLDLFFGPRVFKNDSSILKLFLDRYEFKEEAGNLDASIDLEMWPNFQYFPIAAALKAGYRVASVEVPYHHPSRQTEYELLHKKEFEKKRDMQFKHIVDASMQFVRYLEGDPNVGILKV